MGENKSSSNPRSAGAKDFGKGLMDGRTGLNILKGVVTGDLRSAYKAAADYAKRMSGDVKAIITGKNHPDWYTHYSNSGLIQINLASKQGTVYEAISDYYIGSGATLSKEPVRMPSVATLIMQLTTPNGDEEGWKAGVKLLWDQLSTANAGKVNFTMSMLEAYIQNVRALVAIEAWLHRLYRTTYTFTSSNARIPRELFAAMGVQEDSIMENAGNLFMYIQRYTQRVRVNFPLNVDYYKRTEWLFGNIFVDSSSDKPSYYVPTMNKGLSSQNDDKGIPFYLFSVTSGYIQSADINRTWVGTDTAIWTYNDVITNAEIILSQLIYDQGMSIIAQAIIKAFGDRAFRQAIETKIDDQISFVYDENVLSQLQNSTYVAPSKIFYAQGNVEELPIAKLFAPGSFFYQETFSPTRGITSTIEADFRTTSGGAQLTNGALEALKRRYNTYLYNWHANTISPGEIMSISRLIVSDANEGSSAERIAFGLMPTEVPVHIAAIITDVNDDATLKWLPMGGYIELEGGNDNDGNLLNVITRINMYWANFDWAPRYGFYRWFNAGTLIAPDVVTSEVLDWDVFALAGVDAIRNYQSYANQSLLWAGSSQNQSNNSVYKHTGKSKGKSSPSRKPSKAEADKPGDSKA